MTNRVWKRFLLKIAKFIGSVIVWISLSVGLTYLLLGLGFDINISVFAGILVPLVLFAILIALRLVYEDCKIEVARENRVLMRSIGDKF
jgi:hypothetical protein